MKLEVSDLVDTEIFPCLDEVILIKLMTEIGDHIIVAANSVVTGGLEKPGVYAGSPARMIKER